MKTGMTNMTMIDLPRNRNVEIRDHIDFPHLSFEIVSSVLKNDAATRFSSHAAHFPFVNVVDAASSADPSMHTYYAWFADNGSWVYIPRHMSSKQQQPQNCFFPHSHPEWLTFLRMALVRDIPSLAKGHHGWNACMVTWEQGCGALTENAMDWTVPDSTVAMVLLGGGGEGDAGQDQDKNNTGSGIAKLTVEPVDNPEAKKSINRICQSGTVLLWRGRPSWTKWKFTLASTTANNERYFRICFYRIDPLCPPLRRTETKSPGFLKQITVMPVYGLPLPSSSSSSSEKKNEKKVLATTTSIPNKTAMIAGHKKRTREK